MGNSQQYMELLHMYVDVDPDWKIEYLFVPVHFVLDLEMKKRPLVRLTKREIG